MGDFVGKVVLVTGAGEGIGRELTVAFGARGAMVAANALTPINLDETITQVRANGGRVQGYVADIASKLALQTMLNEIVDQFGRIDYLIQAGGVEPRDRLLEIDEWDWRRTLDSNLTGPFLLMQSVGRVMRGQGEGVMVNLVCVDDESRAAVAGKAGLLALTQVAANEYEAYGIRVNAISCGGPAAEQLAGFPENPVDLVFFLCSGESLDVSGKVIRFDAWG